MYNRNALHVKLYKAAGPRHVILKTQKMLASELSMSQFTLNRIMSEMVDDQRIRIIGKGNHASKRYVVYDPIDWCERRHDYNGAEYARQELGVSSGEAKKVRSDPVEREDGEPKPAEPDEPDAESEDPSDPGFAVSDIFFGGSSR